MWNYVEHYLGPGLTNNQIYFTLLCCWLVIHEICRQHRLFSTDIEILLHVSLAELVSQDCSWSALNLCCFIIYWYCPKLIKKIKHLDMRHAQKAPKKECHFLSIKYRLFACGNSLLSLLSAILNSQYFEIILSLIWNVKASQNIERLATVCP